MSILSNAITITARYGINTLGSFINFAKSQSNKASSTSQQQLRAAWFIFLVSAQLFIIGVGVIVLTYIFYRLFLYRPTKTQPKDKNGKSQPSSNDSGAYTHNTVSAALSAIALTAALLAVSISSLSQVLTTTTSFLITLLPILAPLTGLFIFSTVVLLYNDTVFEAINTANLNWIRPAFDYFINPIITMVLLGYQSIYGGWVTILRLIAFFTYGPILILLQCSFNFVIGLFYQLGLIAAYFIYGIAYWIANNPIFAEIPLLDTFLATGQLLESLWVGPVECFCSVLNYVVGGIGRTFNNVNLAEALTNLVNFIWVTPAAFIIRPLVTSTGPQVTRVYELQSGTLTSLGKWLEDVATYQFDIYIYGGNGTLVGMVNGTLPLPTDDLKYLVFFLQSEWAEMLAHAVNAVFAGFLWEPLNIAFNAQVVFSANGASVFQWNMVRNETLLALNGLATVLDIAPLCQNPGFSINFGALISPLKAIVWLLQATSDIIVGEFYSLIVPPGQVPGFFLATYLLQNALPLMQFETEVNNTAEILGCILAYLDDSLGKSVEGLLSAFLIWIPRIPIQLLAFIRYILQTGEVDALDAVNVDQLEQAFLEIAIIGQIFFQFQPGADELTCPTTVSFFCALGIAVQSTFSFFFRAIILATRSIINLLKIVIQGIATQTLAQVTPPDFTPLLNDGYAVGCRLGVILGTFIPLDVPCMGNQPGFCKVLEFPGQIESTISICLATLLCKVGNLLIVPIDIFVTAVTYVVTFNFTNSSLVVLAVKQVMNVIIFRVLSPVCPLAHFFDCIFDAIVGGGQTAATGFFCLITGALVFLFNTLSDVIVQLLQWIINVIIFIFGGFTQADAAKVLIDLIIQFFTIVGTSLEKIFLALLNLVLSVFFSILVTICRIINFFIFFSITQQCNELEASLNNVLGGGATNFLGPDYTNYKRDANNGEEINANGCKRTPADSIEVMSIQFLEGVYTRYPKLKRFDFINTEKERLGLNVQSKRDTSVFNDDDGEICDANSSNKKRDTPIQPGFYEQLINKTFGPGPTNPQYTTTYLYTHVQWEKTSNCYTTLKLLNGITWDNVGIAERIMVYDCVRNKMMAVGLSNTYTILKWLPEDMFYNTGFRSIALGIGVARFSAVALNWASDRTVPYSILMSNEYQDQWRAIKLDTSHYNTTFLPLYPGPDATPYEYAPLMTTIKSMTLQSYLKRNFPAIYDPNRLEDDPILSPLQDMYEFMGEFAMDSLMGVYNSSSASLKANETSKYGPYYPTNTIYYGHDLNNRTAIWLEYGDEALEAFDTRVSTLQLYDSLSSFFMGIWEWGGKFGNLLTSKNGGGNFKRTVESTTSLPNALYQEYPRLKRVAQERFGNTMDRMYREANAFKRDKPRTIMIQTVDTIGRLAAHFMGSNITEVPPWCIQFISKNTGIPYDLVLSVYETNKTKLSLECRDEAWRESLRTIGYGSSTNDSSSSIWTDPFGFAKRFLRPRNEQARINQDAVLGIFSTSAQAVWNTYYTIFGNDGTTMLDRMQKSQEGKVPSISDYIFKSSEIKDANYQNEPRFRSEEIKNYIKENGLGNNGIPWQIVTNDYNMWKAEQGLDEVTSSSESLKLFFFGETTMIQPRLTASSTSNNFAITSTPDAINNMDIRSGNAPNIGKWRNQLVKQTREYLYRDYDMEIISAALRAQRNNPKLMAKGLKFKPQSEKMLYDLGLSKEMRDSGETTIRVFSVFNRKIYSTSDATTWKTTEQNNKDRLDAFHRNKQQQQHFMASNNNDQDIKLNFQHGEDINKFIKETFEPLPATNSPNVNYYTVEMHNIVLIDNGVSATAFLNLTGILVKTCQSQVTWLCQNCYFADQIVGLLVTRSVYLFNYYTGYYIDFVSTTVPYLSYSFTDNATVISGNGTNSPWFPALNEPMGTFLQFTQNEIDNGLSLTHWISYITGQPVPALVENGPMYQLIYNYTISLTPTTPLQQNVMYDILSFIEFKLGWPILQLIDTVVAFFEEDLEGIADFAVHHIGFCTYTVEIDCSQQQYSFSGGAIVLFFYYFIALVVATIIFQPAPYMTVSIFMALVISFPFVHAVITYGWSVRCLAFPQCYFKDLWDLWVYTIYPKCLPLAGTFVSSGNYTADTCFNRTNTWQWANCEDIGFRNIFDSLAYFKLWLGGDLGLTATFTPIYEQYGLSTATTIDWNTTNWDTDPVLFRNFGGCSVLTALPYAIGGISLLLIAATVTASLIASLPALFAAIFVTLYAILAFCFFAILEIDYSYISRSVTEDQEEYYGNTDEDENENDNSSFEPPDGEGGIQLKNVSRKSNMYKSNNSGNNNNNNNIFTRIVGGMANAGAYVYNSAKMNWLKRQVNNRNMNLTKKSDGSISIIENYKPFQL